MNVTSIKEQNSVDEHIAQLLNEIRACEDSINNEGFRTLEAYVQFETMMSY